MPVAVAGLDRPDSVSFRREVIAALNVSGCNAGACHGTPSGKNGFKLSLRGFDPAADYLQLTRTTLRAVASVFPTLIPVSSFRKGRGWSPMKAANGSVPTTPPSR